MLSDRLDPDSPVALYAQAAQVLRDAIREGRWERRLPSEPDLAYELGVSRNTIRKAVAILIGEGVLEVSRGRGTFVVRRPSS